jgi:hypothetical protein
VCLENKTEFAKYKCGHMCCLECTMNEQINMCPLCRLYLFGRIRRRRRTGRTSSKRRLVRTSWRKKTSLLDNLT